MQTGGLGAMPVEESRRFGRFGRVLVSESGVAMALVLSMVILMMILTGTVISLAMNEYQLAGGAESSRRALLLAEGGIELGVINLKQDGDWNDGAGADVGLAVGSRGSWNTLHTGPFPAGSSVGDIKVRVCRPKETEAGCPGVKKSVAPLGCSIDTCVWIESTAKVYRSTKRIQVMLRKLYSSMSMDTPIFANRAVYTTASDGSFNLHGSIYIANCVDVPGEGCVGLYMQGNADWLNDVPLSIPGESADTPPYNNKIYVRGRITWKGGGGAIIANRHSTTALRRGVCYGRLVNRTEDLRVFEGH